MRVPFDRTRPGAWISAGLHGSLLLAAIVGFSSNRLPPSEEGIPVEILTDAQFSEMTRGERTAAKPLPDAKPRADRVADKREERDPGEAKIDAPAPPKRPAEVKLADEEAEAAAAPPPPRRVAEAKPEPVTPPPPRPDVAKAEAQAAAAAAKAQADAKAAADAAVAEARKVEAERLAEKQEAEAIERARVQAVRDSEQQKQAAAKAQAEARAKSAALAKAKADAEAKAELDAKMRQVEADAKARADAAAKEKAVADAKAKTESDARAKAAATARAKTEAEAKARRQAEVAETYSPGDISKLLASKDASQSSGATGRDIQKTASLGTATGNSQKLNPSQREQLIGLLSEQLHRCWQVPVAAQTADKPPVPIIRVRLNQDGTLAAEPVVTNSGSGLFQTVAESATRAARRCAPLRIPAQFQPYYNDWRDLLVNFDPRAIG